jgi:branched-subunit amino acid permease
MSASTERAANLLSGVLTAAGLWCTNFLFQAVGAVPEVAGCAFLSTTSVAMPITVFAAVTLARRAAAVRYRTEAIRIQPWPSLLGGLLYCLIGTAVALPRLEAYTFSAALLYSLFICALCHISASACLQLTLHKSAARGSAV